MTRTHHLDDETLVTIAQDNPRESGPAPHIESCPQCAHELDVWRRISELARVSVDSVSPGKVGLPEELFDDVDQPTVATSMARRWGRARTPGGWPTGQRWVIALPIVVVAALVLVLTLSFGSSAPSDAMALETIRDSPTVAAMLSQTVHSSGFEIDRAPQGFIDVEYSYHSTVDPRTNAFETTAKPIVPGGASYASSTTVSDGSLVYLPCDVQWTFIGEKPCLAYPAQSGTGSGSFSLTFLRDASGPVARLGEREIDGVETTGYRVSVPVSALVQDAIASERSLVQYEDSTISNVHVEVWSDQRGLPRQLDFTFLVHQDTLSAVLHASQKEQLSYGTSPLTVHVPRRSTVTVAPNLHAALLLASQYRSALIAYFKQQSGH